MNDRTLKNTNTHKDYKLFNFVFMKVHTHSIVKIVYQQQFYYETKEYTIFGIKILRTVMSEA